MKIMLIEDDESKIVKITEHLLKRNVVESDIILARNMTDFAANLSSDIGLFIIDFKLPSIDNGAVSQNGEAILEIIIKAGKNDSLLVAISSYPDEFPRLREKYEANGCILADFSNPEGWQSTLDHLLVQLNKNSRFDFVVFCALQEERNPFILLSKGKQVVRNGVDCYDLVVNGKKGTVVLLPQMGLVNAAIVAGLCIDRFRPSVVGMSGICGGFEGRAQMGQLFVSSMAYEYQSGKWSSDGFRHDPYQVPTDHITLTHLRALINREGLIADLENGFSGLRPHIASKPEIGIFTSGSAVIADQEYLEQIQSVHRKVNTLDMEVFAIHRAAQLSSCRPPCICAKTVVDLCNHEKKDDLHPYGSYVSAKFLLEAIGDFFCRVERD